MIQKNHKLYCFPVIVAFWFIFIFLFQIVPCISEAFAAGRTVVIVRSQQIDAYDEVIDGFTKGCKEEVIPISAIYDLNGEVAYGKKVVQEIKNRNPKPDLILAVGILATALVKEQFTDVPIIFTMVIYHERFNLHEPNITGISTGVPVANQLKFFEEIPGKYKNVGVIYDPANSGNIISEATTTASELGICLIKKEVTSERKVKSALKEIIKNIDALWIIPDSTVVTKDLLGIILKTTRKRRIPTFCTSSAIVKVGALASISPDFVHTGYQAAGMVRTLLNSPTVISLGIKQPEEFKLSLNIKTAKKIGVDISSLRSRSDVILYP